MDLAPVYGPASICVQATITGLNRLLKGEGCYEIAQLVKVMAKREHLSSDPRADIVKRQNCLKERPGEL